MKLRPRSIAAQSLVFVCFLLAWELLVRMTGIPTYLVPAPSTVLLLLKKEAGDFSLHLVVTAFEAGSGFFMGVSVAMLLAISMYRFERLRMTIMPYCAAFQAIPIVAVAPLLIIWFGSGVQSKILMAAIISFFPTLAVILASFEEVSPEAKLLFRLYRADYSTTVKRLLIPSSLPAIVTGLKVSAGLAVVGAIVAEMTGADQGLGYLILTASYRMETVRLFGAIIMASLLGLAAYVLPGILRRLLPNYWTSSRLGEDR